MESLDVSIDILCGWQFIWDERLLEVEWVVWSVTKVHGLDRSESSWFKKTLL